MKTVNSLSGGKTSSYIAMQYPADYDVFALVTVEDKKLTPNDNGLVNRVSDKIGREFIGTVESDKTLKVVLDLEQEIGREITWVAGDTFEEVIRKKKMIPTQMARFCTTQMKFEPIFSWWYRNLGETVKMRIGFRLDEFERAERYNPVAKYRLSTNTFGQKRNNWGKVKWQIGEFPLIDDRLTHRDIVKFWEGKGFDFPKSSNCVGCFWKSDQELRQNWEEEPVKMKWFSDQEKKWNANFKLHRSMNEIKRIGLQSSMHFGGGSCKSEGYCTD